MATDISGAVMTSILASDQAKDLTGSVSNEVDQKARDVFGQVGAAISDITHTIGDVTKPRVLFSNNDTVYIKYCNRLDVNISHTVIYQQ